MPRYAGSHLLHVSLLACSCSKGQLIVNSQVWSCTQLFAVRSSKTFLPIENTKSLCNGNGEELHWAGGAQGAARGFPRSRQREWISKLQFPPVVTRFLWTSCMFTHSTVFLPSESTANDVGGDQVLSYLGCGVTHSLYFWNRDIAWSSVFGNWSHKATILGTFSLL